MPPIGKTQAAYMKMINDQGGVNGRKINLIQYDDAYSPPKAVEQVRKLVESDEVLLTFQLLGTPSNAAVQKYLNSKKVPQLFAATGASKFTDPKNFPWTMGFNPNYFVEGRIYGQYIIEGTSERQDRCPLSERRPRQGLPERYQGRPRRQGREDDRGRKPPTRSPTRPSIRRSSRSRTPAPTCSSRQQRRSRPAQAIKKIPELGWKPVQILDINATSVGAVMKPAGLEASKGGSASTTARIRSIRPGRTMPA